MKLGFGKLSCTLDEGEASTFRGLA